MASQNSSVRNILQNLSEELNLAGETNLTSRPPKSGKSRRHFNGNDGLDSNYDFAEWENEIDEPPSVQKRWSKRKILMADSGWPDEPRMHPLSKLERIREDKGSGRKWLGICAPMVRYSKLPFRELVRGCT